MEKLISNYNAITETLKKEKPLNVKGNFLLSAFISSSMGVSYKTKVKGIN